MDQGGRTQVMSSMFGFDYTVLALLDSTVDSEYSSYFLALSLITILHLSLVY